MLGASPPHTRASLSIASNHGDEAENDAANARFQGDAASDVHPIGHALRRISVSHPRTLQYRHLLGFIALAIAALLTLMIGLAALAAGAITPGGLLLLAGTGATIGSRKSLHLAHRNRIGADSEDAVRQALNQLARQGWEIRHAVNWPGGDIDHLARAPNGLGFAIETKTRGFEERHLVRTLNTAGWLARSRRFPLGVLPVLCVVRSRGLQHWYGTVIVISLDRLLPTLQQLTTNRQHAAMRPMRRAS